MDEDKHSVISAIPSPLLEKHRMEIEDLKWQIKYEKKLQLEMTDILENKVSHFIADIEGLKKKIINLEDNIERKDLEISNLTVKVEEKNHEISRQRAKNLDLINEVDDLKMKGGELSKINFDQLKSKLNLYMTENKQ